MSVCCKCVELGGCKTCKELGCYTHCGDLALPLLAHQSGMHILEFGFNGQKYFKEFSAIQGVAFTLENVFNECGKVKLKIKQPDGTYYECDGYEKFSISLYVGLSLDSDFNFKKYKEEMRLQEDCDPACLLPKK